MPRRSARPGATTSRHDDTARPAHRAGRRADPATGGRAGRRARRRPWPRSPTTTSNRRGRRAARPAGRRRPQARASASCSGRKAAMRWIADAVADVAPHVPVRDLDDAAPALSTAWTATQLADRLVRNAARATAGIGAAGGGVAAIEWAVTPTLLSAPVLLAAETVAVVAHRAQADRRAARGVRPAGRRAAAPQRAVALLQAWAGQRGVNLLVPGVGVGRRARHRRPQGAARPAAAAVRPQPDHARARC